MGRYAPNQLNEFVLVTFKSPLESSSRVSGCHAMAFPYLFSPVLEVPFCFAHFDVFIEFSCDVKEWVYALLKNVKLVASS